MYNAGLTGSLPGKPRVSLEPKMRPAMDSATPAQPAFSDTVQQAMMQAMGLMADGIDQLGP